MFLIGLGVELAILAVVAVVAAIVVVIGLAVGLITHPLRTIALVLNKLASLAGGLALILAVFTWFAVDHATKDFDLVFWGSVAATVAGILIHGFTEWFLSRPTRAKRRIAGRETRTDMDLR